MALVVDIDAGIGGGSRRAALGRGINAEAQVGGAGRGINVALVLDDNADIAAGAVGRAGGLDADAIGVTRA
jgi:hypothetical protein